MHWIVYVTDTFIVASSPLAWPGERQSVNPAPVRALTVLEDASLQGVVVALEEDRHQLGSVAGVEPDRSA